MIKVFETNYDYNLYTLNNTSLLSDILYYVKEDNTGHFYTNNIDGESKIYDLGGGDTEDDRIVAIFKKVDYQSNDYIFGMDADSYIDEIEIDGVKQESIQQSVPLPQGNHVIKYKLKDNTCIPENMFSICSSMIYVTLPSTITEISQQGFASCSNLTSININNNLGNITFFGYRAFNGCKSLASIIIDSTTPPAIGRDELFSSSYVPRIYVPAELVDAYKAASGWSKYADNIVAIP